MIMKTLNYNIKLLSAIILGIGMSLLISACEEDAAEPSAADVVKAKLISSTWKMSSVVVDGSDQTDIYSGLNLSFTSSGFTTVNGGVVWPSSGTWEFTSEQATAIKRNDGLTIEIVSITDTSLKLGLTWSKSTVGSGRVSSISGAHVFNFGK